MQCGSAARRCSSGRPPQAAAAAAAAAAAGQRRPGRRRLQQCSASSQLERPLQRPGDASALQQQASSRPQQPQLGRPGQLLSRPSRAATPEPARPPAARRSKRVLLDDGDTKMAAFDQLVLQVTSPPGSRPPKVAVSFNGGPAAVRPVIAANLKAARIQRPTPLQGHMVPVIKAGCDVLAAGPSGAGASTAALLGVLCRLLSTPRSLHRNRALPLGLLLCPSRELAAQLAAQGAAMVAGSQLTVKCATGGAPIAQQVLELRRGADLLVATPGRLLDLLSSKVVSLARLQVMVMEEVEELMGPSLLPFTRQLLHHHSLPPHGQRQTVALGSAALTPQQLLATAGDVLRPSAVLVRASWALPAAGQLQQQLEQPPPQQLEQQEQQLEQQEVPPPQLLLPPALGAGPQAGLAALLANPAAALAAAAAAAAASLPPSVSQRFLGVSAQLKPRALLRLLAGAAGGGGGLVLVFTNTASAADEVAAALEAAGVAAGVLHHGRSQLQRDEALACFRYGVTQVLVACGVGYRGLDLPDVLLVVNYDVPHSLAEYARRAGRAGRCGRPGSVSTLLTPGDAGAAAPLAALLRAGGQPVPAWLDELAAGGSGGSDSDEAQAAELQQERPQQQQHAGSGSALFSVARGREAPAFGGYAAPPAAPAAAAALEPDGGGGGAGGAAGEAGAR